MFVSTVMLGFSLKAEYAMHWQMGDYQQVSQCASTVSQYACWHILAEERH
jgi:hypothetical protein